MVLMSSVPTFVAHKWEITGEPVRISAWLGYIILAVSTVTIWISLLSGITYATQWIIKLVSLWKPPIGLRYGG